MDTGISDYGVYVPRYRLSGTKVAGFFMNSPGRGVRSVASFDEDSTTMGFEAARQARMSQVDGIVFASTTPAYCEKSNASTIHAALGTSHSSFAFDACGSTRSGAGALRLCLEATKAGRRLVAIAADVQTAQPGDLSECLVGDGAVALACSTSDVLASLLAVFSTTDEYLDVWRLPQENHARRWDERFSEGPALAAGRQAIAGALSEAGLSLEMIDHVVVSGRPARAVGQLERDLGSDARLIRSTVGRLGTADLGVGIALAFDAGAPGDVVLAVNLADGADAFVFRLTELLPEWRSARSPIRLEANTIPVSYSRFLSWRGELQQASPRRPMPTAPAGPPSYRNKEWKYKLAGSVCSSCGTVQLPPSRACVACGSVDEMKINRFANVHGRLSFVADDHLSFSQSPPRIVGVVDLDGGGRVQVDVADPGALTHEIGDEMEFVFRKYFTADSIHDYFWKARRYETEDSE